MARVGQPVEDFAGNRSDSREAARAVGALLMYPVQQILSEQANLVLPVEPSEL